MADEHDPDAIRAIFEKASDGGAADGGDDGGEDEPAGGSDEPRRNHTLEKPRVAPLRDGQRVRLKGISARAYEHPTDRAALSALRKIPGFDMMLRKLFGVVSERSLRLLYLANTVQVGERQFTRVHALWQETCAILDVEKMPDLFVAQMPLVNAGAIGLDEPFVVINSGTLELLDDDEVRFVLAHELGHIISGHVLYKTMLRILLNMTVMRARLVVGAALMALILALMEWDRKSELSSDRAGLLGVQDPQTAYRVHMKMAGGSRVEEMSVDAFIEQAQRYEEGDARDSILKVLLMLNRTHPFAVSRLAELKRWAESGEYERILAGDYPLRRDDDLASVKEDVAAGVNAYRDAMNSSEDSLTKLVAELSQAVSDAGSAVWTQVRDAFGSKDEASGDDADDPDAAKTPDA